MKIYRTRLSLITTVYLPLFAIYLLLYLFKKQELLGFRSVHWVFLALSLAMLISPQRSESYNYDQKKLPWPTWLICMIGFVSLLSSYFYFSNIFLNNVLTINKPHDLPSLITIDTMHTGGLFPWAIFALFATALQRVYFTNKNAGLISDYLQPIFSTSQYNNIGKYCNTYLRITIFFSLLLPLFFIGLSILFFLMNSVRLSSGISVQNLFITCVFFYIINFSRWQIVFNWLIKIGFPTLLAMIIFQSLAMSLLALLLIGIQSFPFSYDVHYYPFDPAMWNIVLEMLGIFMALSWAPLASSTIAILSRGYRKDQIILMTLLIPSLTLFLKIPEHSFSTKQIALILLICSILLLMIFLKNSFITSVSRGIFPSALTLKQRKPMLYLNSLQLTAITLVGIFWVTGIYLVALLVSAFALSSSLLIMASTLYQNSKRIQRTEQESSNTSVL